MSQIMWFRHDTTASGSTDVLKLHQRLGVAGVGCHWILLEHFVAAGGEIPWSGDSAEALAFATRIDRSTLDAFITLGIEIGLLEQRDGQLRHLRALDELENYEKISRKKSRAASARYRGSTCSARAVQVHSTCSADAVHVQHNTDNTDSTVQTVQTTQTVQAEQKKEGPPVRSGQGLSEEERKKLLGLMSPEELEYWVHLVHLYRAEKGEHVAKNLWAVIQRWRDRVISEGREWEPARKAYIRRQLKPVADDAALAAARRSEIRKRMEESERADKA